jgi:hypothetical protein
MSDWMELIRPMVDLAKSNKQKRRWAKQHWSSYRMGKSLGHKTTGGLGMVQKLVKNRKRIR